MPIAKNRRKKVTSRIPRAPPQALPTKPRRTLVRTVLSTPALLLGFVAAAITIWESYFQTIPSIELVASDPQSAFAFPFAVRNESPFFAARDVEWTCRLVHVEDQAGNTFDNVALESGGTAEIEPRGIENYRCSIQFIADPIKSASVTAEVHYKTLGIPRSTSHPFTWFTDTTTPRWIDGAEVR